MSEHTALPWAYINGRIVGQHARIPQFAQSVASIITTNNDDENAADNATLIVQSVNDRPALIAERDALRGALQGVLRVADRATVEFDAARAALGSTTEAVAHPSAREAPAWQPIETAPKDGTRVLVSFGTRGIEAVSWTEPASSDWEIWCVDDGKHGPYALRGYSDKGNAAPTHWQPLPAPPAVTRPDGQTILSDLDLGERGGAA